MSPVVVPVAHTHTHKTALLQPVYRLPALHHNLGSCKDKHNVPRLGGTPNGTFNFHYILQ